MKPITAEWIAKAEADYATMLRESCVTNRPNWDGVCFHAQQCAEKYLKARLCEAGIPFGKIHDLVQLLNAAVPVEPGWKKFQRSLAYLSEFAVAYRYPGDSADKDMALQAIEFCSLFRKALLEWVGNK
ncbi:MAG: HEPN domain-containing protein [Phycisphaerae bacterium]|nr:HEPN domain-containing protein [Phycisphaerae bacterium]